MKMPTFVETQLRDSEITCRTTFFDNQNALRLQKSFFPNLPGACSKATTETFFRYTYGLYCHEADFVSQQRRLYWVSSSGLPAEVAKSFKRLQGFASLFTSEVGISYT